MKRQQRLTLLESFVPTAFTIFITFLPRLCFLSHYRRHSLFEQWDYLLYHLAFYSFRCILYAHHDGAIKENICQLCSWSTLLSQVTITISNDTGFLSGCFFFPSFMASHQLSVFFFYLFCLFLYQFTCLHGRGSPYIAKALSDIMN